MRICHACNEEIRPDVKFCTECGAKQKPGTFSVEGEGLPLKVRPDNMPTALEEKPEGVFQGLYNLFVGTVASKRGLIKKDKKVKKATPPNSQKGKKTTVSKK